MRISPPAANKSRFCGMFLLLSLLLLGCAGQESDLETYLQRLSDSLDTSIPPAQASEALVMPRPPKPPLASTPASIGMLDLWSIRQCRLHKIIADHNSALGKVAVRSERLLYTLDFLQWAPPCAEKLSAEGETELADILMAAHQDYRQRLPAQIWRATLGGPEFRQFWRRSGVSIGDTVQQQSTDSLRALASLEQMVQAWLSGDYDLQSEDSRRERLNQALSSIARGDGGALLLAMESIQIQLARANALLDERLQRRPLCLSGQPTPKAKRLLGIVTRYFAKGIQQRSAAYNQRVYKILPPVQALEQALSGAEPASWRDWRLRRDQRFEQARNAPARHVKALLPLLDQCGLAPGG